MKIGLYGGTFDPIHHGHLILAREAMETLALDRVIFIPAARSPHKLDAAPAPDALRLKMVKLAISDEPKFEVDDCDLRRSAPSFAFDTVQKIRARFANDELFYFIGEDNARDLATWHRFSELEKLVQFVLLARVESAAPLITNFSRIARHIDISATDIRSRVAKGASIRYLVPESVRSVIESERLYQNTNQEPHH